MKKIFLLIFLPTLLYFGISCSNEIDLTADWKDIPVVYGFLAASDSVHYIRVEKAFIDSNTSALDIAQRPDSLYYDNAVVQIQKVNSTDSPLLFQRVDANEEGFTREEGTFATAPNYIYKYVFPQGESFEALSEYELQINRGDNLPLVTGSTTILDNADIRSPLAPDNINYKPFKWGENDNGWALEISWRANPSAALFDVVLLLHIDEHNVNDPNNPTQIDLEWEVDQGLLASEGSNNGTIVAMKSRISSESFFSYIKSSFEVNNEVFRRFKGLDIIIKSGGEAIKEYADIGLTNGGITSSQVIPTYTNMSEGFGIIASRNETRFEGHSVSFITQDSLANGSFTEDLNFQF